jgi:hypothetical protein
MEFVLNSPPARQPRVSFLLLDWSCRESLHILDYLNNQTVPRDQYEILWVEYYQKRSQELCDRIAAARAAGVHPPVDVYGIMGMPTTICYHKHLIYNVGILLARGRIICMCDSDAIMHPTFVESIIQQFQADPNIVLHLDEVRNNDHKFYPFNYPDFEDVVGPGVANWMNGRPLGLSDVTDPLHTRNYGACMCALRDDLIAIGGADMHMDYLGHICGPYELTFRLINAGKREIWHDREWLYHVWHPGQAGDRNYAGPHDGKHMSTTALDARRTGRVEPLVVHPAIAKLRQGTAGGDGTALLDEIAIPQWLKEWDISGVETQTRSYRLGTSDIALHERAQKTPAASEPAVPKGKFTLECRPGRIARVMLVPLVISLLARQFLVKRTTARLRVCQPGVTAAAWEQLRKFTVLWGFVQRMLVYNRYLLRVCWVHLCYVATLGQSEVALYGDGDAARILGTLSKSLPVRIRAICPLGGLPSRRHRGVETWNEQQLAAYDGLVIVATFVNSAEHVRRLQHLGLDRDRLVVLE